MTARPLISVVLPTCGRPTLERTLASIREQGDASTLDIVVVGDSHAGTFAAALREAEDTRCDFEAEYFEYDGGQHCVGQPQRQYGMTVATGEWLMWSQDDCIMPEGAWMAIETALIDGPPCPRLFRATTRHGGLVWATHDLTEGNVDANLLVTPNDPARLGRWQNRYAGDYDMIRDTVALWNGQVRWEPAIISRHIG